MVQMLLVSYDSGVEIYERFSEDEFSSLLS